MQEPDKKADLTFKIVIVGESGVGKSCILLQYSKGTFTSHHITTIGVDFYNKFIEIQNKIIKMQIWDTAGQERFKSISTQYLRQAHGILLVYDITDSASFQKVGGWMTSIKENTEAEKIHITLVGNKSDLADKRVITTDMGRKLAKEYNIDFFEVSARNNQKISEMFDSMTKKIISADDLGFMGIGLQLKKNDVEKNKKGCNNC